LRARKERKGKEGMRENLPRALGGYPKKREKRKRESLIAGQELKSLNKR